MSLHQSNLASLATTFEPKVTFPILYLVPLVIACSGGPSANSGSASNTGGSTAGGSGQVGAGGALSAGLGGTCGTGLCVAELSLASEDSCVLLSDGTAKCWGNNEWGQLGEAAPDFSGCGYRCWLSPLLVQGLSVAAQVAPGGSQSCALLRDGTVECWGYNGYGGLGDGTFVTRPALAGVQGLSDIVRISTGEFHSCALLANRTVKCWGNNSDGQLGDGTTSRRPTPVVVQNLSNAASIATGSAGTNSHSCALLGDGTVECWGYNYWGQLGDGTTNNSSTPVLAQGLSNATQISVGGYHSCARLADGTVKCWGLNTDGQVGDGTRTSILVPTNVQALSNVTQVSAGGFHSCALLGDGTVKCWGLNRYGEIGDGTTAGTDCGWTDDPESCRLTPVAVLGLSDVVQVATGGFHSCARLGDGTVKCWGSNGSGELGDGTTTDRLTPLLVTVLP